MRDPSCLSGDIFGDYSFTQLLAIGQRLTVENMAIYTMVKNTTSNGIPHPAIAVYNSESDQLRIVKPFGYDHFLGRLS